MASWMADFECSVTKSNEWFNAAWARDDADLLDLQKKIDHFENKYVPTDAGQIDWWKTFHAIFCTHL